MVFKCDITSRTLTIISIDDVRVTVQFSNLKGTSDFHINSLTSGLRTGGWLYEEKPLDKAMKILDKQFCIHKNVKHDKYFTAKVFSHCADCGKAL